MAATERLVLDVAAGVVRAGPLTSSAALVPGGVRVGDAVVRALSFGERSMMVDLARAAGAPVAAVRAGTIALAVTGACDPLVEAVALYLAGAGRGGERGPGFAETAARVARVTGWTPAQLAGCAAAEVDRLAIALGGARPTSGGGGGDDDDAGWRRFELLADHEGEPAAMAGPAGASGVDELIRRLCEELLARAVEAPADGVAAPVSAAGGRSVHELGTTREGRPAAWPLAPAGAPVAGGRRTDSGGEPRPPRPAEEPSGGGIAAAMMAGRSPVQPASEARAPTIGRLRAVSSVAPPAGGPVAVLAEPVAPARTAPGAPAELSGIRTVSIARAGTTQPPVARHAAPIEPAPAAAPRLSAELADELGRLLADECDLRGLLR